MFKLPKPPSPRADSIELADFIEILCWRRGTTSAREISAYLGQVDENDHNIGCEDDQDAIVNQLDEVMAEIERRASACVDDYPFQLRRSGTVVTSLPDNTARALTYLFLLLSTRLDMSRSREHASINGTEVLERLGEHAIRSYLGISRAKAMVFGTSNRGSFKSKVESLCTELGEGGGFRSLDNAPVRANDGKVDVVGWLPFADQSPGQLMIFCQCKSGTKWRDATSQLHPREFNTKWMSEPFLVEPVRAFCVAEALDRSIWKSQTVSAGILLNSR